MTSEVASLSPADHVRIPRRLFKCCVLHRYTSYISHPFAWPCLFFLTLLCITVNYWLKCTLQLLLSTFDQLSTIQIERIKTMKKKSFVFFSTVAWQLQGKEPKDKLHHPCIPIKLRVPQKVPPARLSLILERSEMRVQQFNTLLFTAVQFWPANLNVFSWLFLLQGKGKTFAYTLTVSLSSRKKKQLQQEDSNSHAMQKKYIKIWTRIFNKNMNFQYDSRYILSLFWQFLLLPR